MSAITPEVSLPGRIGGGFTAAAQAVYLGARRRSARRPYDHVLEVLDLLRDSVFKNLEVSFPQGRTVLGALFFKRTEEVRDRVRTVAGEIGLDRQLDREAGLLSHGEKQWLEIGMLLIQDPELLMLDEPVAGMSVGERIKTAELLNQIIKGRSVLVIEHDMKFVEDIAHRVTVLHQGKVLSEGSMERVKNDPKVIEVYLGH